MCIESIPFSSWFAESFIENGCLSIRYFFWNWCIMSIDFFNVKPNLHSWCKYCIVIILLFSYIVGFYLLYPAKHWAIALHYCFLIMLSSGFGIRVMMSSKNELGNIYLSSVICKSLYKIGVISSLKVSLNLPVNLNGSWVSFVRM